MGWAWASKKNQSAPAACRAPAGTLPGSWHQITSLRSLNLSYNALEGPLPLEWGRLFQLETLKLGECPLHLPWAGGGWHACLLRGALAPVQGMGWAAGGQCGACTAVQFVALGELTCHCVCWLTPATNCLPACPRRRQ